MKKEHLTDAVICRMNDKILEVSRILRDTQRRHLIVLNDNDSPIGIISTVDINNRVVAENKDPEKTKATEIMTKNPAMTDLGDSYEKAYQTMARLGTHSIPVTEKGKLIGMLEFMTALNIKRQEGK
ncbi:CBS domain-containing protein [Candidatus Woesearchaeota archaeon]|nr:CBS domain-containing protein [Candidatus Woesearchaeota archaeon]